MTSQTSDLTLKTLATPEVVDVAADRPKDGKLPDIPEEDEFRMLKEVDDSTAAPKKVMLAIPDAPIQEDPGEGDFNLKATATELLQIKSQASGIVLEEFQTEQPLEIFSGKTNTQPITDAELEKNKSEDLNELQESDETAEASKGDLKKEKSKEKTQVEENEETEEKEMGEAEAEGEETPDGEENAEEKETTDEDGKQKRLSNQSSASTSSVARKRQMSAASFGDFKMKKTSKEDTFVIADHMDSELAFEYEFGLQLAALSQYSREEEEEAKKEQEEEGPVEIDRPLYYEKFFEMIPQMEKERIKNNILNKLVANYFKRRKMDYVLRETHDQWESLKKYNEKVKALGELKNTDTLERKRISEELKELTDQRNKEQKTADQSFVGMQSRLRTVGTGLINTKTGNPISDQQIEYLLRRQRYQTKQLAIIRMELIRLRNSIAEKEKKIRAIENKLGKGLTLAYYDHLKLENRTRADKIDEKDDECAKLRVTCRDAMQKLAHFKEKIVCIDLKLQDHGKDLLFFNMSCDMVRDEVNEIRQKRDKYRKTFQQLCEQSGLLAQPKLLRDMEDAIKEVDRLTKEVEKVETEYKLKTDQIRALRKNIELASNNMYFSKEVGSSSTLGSLLEPVKRSATKRPTLINPVISERQITSDIKKRFLI